MKMDHLRLEDISDMAFLEAFDACLANSKTCTTESIAAQLELDVLQPNRFVGCRLGWLRKYKLVDRDEGTKEWMWTKKGQDLFKSRTLTSREQESLEKLGAKREMGLASFLSTRMDNNDDTTSTTIRRQIRHVELKRKKGFSR